MNVLEVGLTDLDNEAGGRLSEVRQESGNQQNWDIPSLFLSPLQLFLVISSAGRQWEDMM